MTRESFQKRYACLSHIPCSYVIPTSKMSSSFFRHIFFSFLLQTHHPFIYLAKKHFFESVAFYFTKLIMAEVRNGVGKMLTEYINVFSPGYINCFLNIWVQHLKRRGLVVIMWFLSGYCAHLDWNGVAMSKSLF